LKLSEEEIFDLSGNLGLRPNQDKEEFVNFLRTYKNLKPKYVLEIGSELGGSFFCLMLCARKDATLISVEINKEPLFSNLDKIYSYKSERQKLHFIWQDSHLEGTKIKVQNILKQKELDVLFIDGDHSYQSVSSDFFMYEPLVRKGGLIVFHDIKEHPPGTFCEVKPFWDEIKRRYYFIEIFNFQSSMPWAGIGILVK